MIDLHSHTDYSDGTDTPAELLARAIAAGLDALAVTDHDTLGGYQAAAPLARERGFDLVCGVELSTKHHAKTVHLLAYFLDGGPAASFTTWLAGQQTKRRDRNARLVERLRAIGLDITLGDVEALGRTMTGRPHFARVLLKKGYVRTMQEAFDRYIAEEGSAYVEREEVPLSEAIQMVREGNGLAVMAHPIRLGRRNPEDEEVWIAEAAAFGMQGLECIHSDHSPDDVRRYLALAAKLNLLPTGGSDYHGGNKPDIDLGSGRSGNVQVPKALLDDLRGAAVHR